MGYAMNKWKIRWVMWDKPINTNVELIYWTLISDISMRKKNYVKRAVESKIL